MSGFDFGNQFCLIAVTKRGGIEVIANEASSRQTVSLVGFGEKQRVAGEPASTQYITNIKNTISQVKRFIGLKYSEVEQEIERFPYAVVRLENDEVGFEVSYKSETTIFTPTQVLAVLFGKLKQTMGAHSTGSYASDVVVSVPGYFNDSQRRATLEAAEISGLHCLRLMNETTATALSYGFFKVDLPTEESKPPQHVILFIDVGHSATSSSVVAFSKGKMKVLSATFDKDLGGRNFDDLLVSHFAEEFRDRYHIDVRSNPRSLLRLSASCEKLKHVLSSGVSQATLNIESLMNDLDVTSSLTRVSFEEMAAPLFEKMSKVVECSLSEANVKAEELYTVEIVGASRRMPAIQSTFKNLLKKDIGTTLNDVESVAKGCALQCAILSPVYKVKDFQIIDFQPLPIVISWNYLNGEVSEDILFKRGNAIPSTKIFTLKQAQPFQVKIQYQNEERTLLCHYKANSLKCSSDIEAKENKVEVRIKINIHGIATIDSVQLVEVYEVEEVVKPATPVTPAPTAAAPSSEGDKKENEGKDAAAAAAEASSESDPKKEATDEPQQQQQQQMEPALKKKKKTRHTEIPGERTSSSLSTSQVQSLIEKENEMMAQDRLAIETAEAKNSLESYILDFRGAVADELYDYGTSEEREQFNSLSYQLEDWIYEDGENETKSVYVAKLEEVKALGKPFSDRKDQETRAENSHAELLKSISWYRSNVNDPRYEHIEQSEKEKILSLCSEVENEFAALVQQQSNLTKIEPRVLLSSAILAKKKELEKSSNAILSKPKPQPPKEEEKKTTEQKEEEKTAESPQKEPEESKDVPMSDDSATPDSSMNSEVD